LTELCRLDKFLKDSGTPLPTSGFHAEKYRNKQNPDQQDQTITESSVLGEPRMLLTPDQLLSELLLRKLNKKKCAVLWLTDTTRRTRPITQGRIKKRRIARSQKTGFGYH
jgi:predicted nuclease of predicted toxin-antitoxin system